MGQETPTDESRTDENAEESNAGNRTYVDHVDGIKGKFDHTPVHAQELIEVSFPEGPTEYDLAALQGESGKEVAVFDPSENVHLDEQHRTHFDTKGDGRNYV